MQLTKYDKVDLTMPNSRLAIVLFVALFLGLPLICSAEPRLFSFALIGDQEYDAAQSAKFANLIDDINKDPTIEFIIHDGDIKSGASPCSNELYQQRRDEFNRFNKPLIYLFGDNEWVDCHRPAAGGFDPLERLAALRKVFTPDGASQSLGRQARPLERQSKQFPENVRWREGGVVFVGLNVPGSNNGLETAAKFARAAKAEFAQRNVANLQWLKEAFALARKENAPGVMVAFQANPWDQRPSRELTGYQALLGVLEAETVAFGKPVVLVHGDSHYFRIDKPLPTIPFDAKQPYQPPLWESAAPRLENFTRVETFGTVNVHWIKATVDPASPSVFRFDERIVEKNRTTR
jgi:hypothetical protein